MLVCCVCVVVVGISRVMLSVQLRGVLATMLVLQLLWLFVLVGELFQ